MTLWISVAFVYGIAIGSFLNVVIWRLPRGGSVAAPTWSFCPRCEHRLGAWDLLPIVSFLVLRARCRYCRAPISWRYPGIETLTGFLFALVAWRFGGTWETIFDCLFVAVLICVFFIDLEHFVIPDGLNVLGVVIGFVHGALARVFSASLAGFFGYAALLYAVGLIAYVILVGVSGKRIGPIRAAWDYGRENALDWAWILVYYAGALIPPLRRYAEPPPPLIGTTAGEIEADEDAGGMGGGDGKLAAAIGANLLWPLWLYSWFFGIVLGAVAGVIVLVRARRKLGERVAVPFGPAMAAGALIALLFGQSIVHWYVSHFLTFPGSSFSSSSGRI